MIAPNMATMLGFITTDVAICHELLEKALRKVNSLTYSMVSVDGDTSTNATLILMSSGLAKNPEITCEDKNYEKFENALYAVMMNLARETARDGEGATKLLECIVKGAPDENTAKVVAKSVISSSLVKAAMFAADANWGRILCAIGYAKADFDITKVSVELASEKGKVTVCTNGAGVSFSEESASEILSEDEIKVLVDLHCGEGEAIAWGCDLTFEYVKINAEYRTLGAEEMQIDYDIRANALVEALPYLQEYNDKVVVVKYGGNAMTNETLKQAVMQDIVLLSLVGIKVVLVHGGGPEINAMLKKINKQSEFVNGLRYTDEETIDIVQMVLAGKVNKDLVQLLQRAGGKAMGLCGLDGDLIKAKQLNPDLGFVGDITEIDPDPINTALNNGYIPVVSTVASGKNGEVFNINADTAAARIAAEMGAANLILLPDIKGLLEDKDDDSTLIRVVGVSEVPYLKNQGIISGGMIPKIDCCVEAVRRGVKKTNIIDGRIPHSILIELLTDIGAGTMIIP